MATGITTGFRNIIGALRHETPAQIRTPEVRTQVTEGDEETEATKARAIALVHEGKLREGLKMLQNFIDQRCCDAEEWETLDIYNRPETYLDRITDPAEAENAIKQAWVPRQPSSTNTRSWARQRALEILHSTDGTPSEALASFASDITKTDLSGSVKRNIAYKTFHYQMALSSQQDPVKYVEKAIEAMASGNSFRA